jgi:malto-oligosyltrehalose trehalohydrolase
MSHDDMRHDEKDRGAMAETTMAWGALPLAGGGTRFRTWAPASKTLSVEIARGDRIEAHPLTRQQDGFFEGVVAGVAAGDRYRYRLEQGRTRPDPASRRQPESVHGWSEVVDPSAYGWRDASWTGVARDRLVIYELHVGTFTTEGTFAAAERRIGELVELGVTAVELMPLAQAAGRWNWGYDGVHYFAVRDSYGTPDELKSLVDACHAAGIAVLLDVVYNHPGPEGNYLGEYGPYFSTRHGTPWGPAFNYDGPDCAAVRDYIVQNALYWFREYHLDGLRLDAVHFMFDDSRPTIVADITAAVDQLADQLGRPLFVIGETNVHDVHSLTARQQQGVGMHAIWCDDLMHSILSIASPDRQLSHRVYHGAPDLAEVLEHGYLYHGAAFERVQDREPLGAVDQGAFVVGLQNHDSIGNHPRGFRIHHLAGVDFQRAAAPLALLHPAIPLLFMGEEYACRAPFYFFVDFEDPYLRKLIADSRAKEYAQHDWQDAVSPLDERAFYDSRCGEAADGDLGMRGWYRQLLGLRKAWQAAGHLQQRHLKVHWDRVNDLFIMEYHAPGAEPVFAVSRLVGPRTEVDTVTLQLAGEVILHSDDPAYGGTGRCAAGGRGGVVLGANQAAVGRGRWA